jgi:hypothetical protein
MEPNPNPVYKWGDLNQHCPYYEDCVDFTIKRNWQYWDCSKCPYKTTQESVDEAPNIHGLLS